MRLCGASYSTPRNSNPASPPHMARASDGDTGVQPLSAVWGTIGNWTEPASVMWRLTNACLRLTLRDVSHTIS